MSEQEYPNEQGIEITEEELNRVAGGVAAAVRRYCIYCRRETEQDISSGACKCKACGTVQNAKFLQ